MNTSNFGRKKKIFIAHRFKEKTLINKLKNEIEKNSFKWSEGIRDDIGSISKDILRKIRESGFVIIVMTKMDRLLKDRKKHTTSPWLLEEKGAALALGYRPLILAETCIDDGHVGEMQGDDQIIPFSRNNFLSKAKEAVDNIKKTYSRSVRKPKVDNLSHLRTPEQHYTYDMTKEFYLTDFNGYGHREWDGEKAYGVRARGELSLKRNIITLKRFNNSGSYIIDLARYVGMFFSTKTLPKPRDNHYVLNVNCKVQSKDAKRLLRFDFYNPDAREVFEKKRCHVHSHGWHPINFPIDFTAKGDVKFRFVDREVSKTNSVLMIKDLVIKYLVPIK